MENSAFIRITRKDKAPLVVGLDVIINGMKAGWVRDESSLIAEVIPGDHVVEVGVVGSERAAFLVGIEPGEIAELTAGRTKSVVRAMFGLKEYYYIELDKLRAGVFPPAMVAARLGDRDYGQYLLDIQETRGGLNKFQEDYLQKYLLRHEEFTSYSGSQDNSNAASTQSDIIGSFATLGLECDATQRDVICAYRELVQIHHPDKGGKASVFTRINKAYQEALAYTQDREK